MIISFGKGEKLSLCEGNKVLYLEAIDESTDYKVSLPEFIYECSQSTIKIPYGIRGWLLLYFWNWKFNTEGNQEE